MLRSSSSRWVQSAVAIALIGLPCRPAPAHSFEFTDALVVFKSDDRYQVDLRIDVDALILGVSPESDDAEMVAALEAMSVEERQTRVDAARQTVQRRVRLRFDGEPQRPWVEFPDAGTPRIDASPIPTVFGTSARLSGRVPKDARQFTFMASRAFGAVQLTILHQNHRGAVRATLDIGARSEPFELVEATQATAPVVAPLRFLVLGFKHILPLGLDHILFVLGLFLLSVRLKPLLLQITAFTVAHTATLALSIAGVVSLPSRLVEPLIALSIAYVALENLVTAKLKPWRLGLVFGFGLLHGLGFAGALRQIGLPPGERISALLTFNLGVELGQLAVVALAFLAVGWFRDRDRYRSVVVMPVSALIALIGLYWSFERTFFGI